MQHFYLYCKDGQNVAGVRISDCKINVQTANGDLVNIVLHDVQYVIGARQNLLSCSQLFQDQFSCQPLPANDSMFCPWIYNCLENETSVDYLLLLLAVSFISTLVLMQNSNDIIVKITCTIYALAWLIIFEDSKIFWVSICHIYVSANVRRGKATSTAA